MTWEAWTTIAAIGIASPPGIDVIGVGITPILLFAGYVAALAWFRRVPPIGVSTPTLRPCSMICLFNCPISLSRPPRMSSTMASISPEWASAAMAAKPAVDFNIRSLPSFRAYWVVGTGEPGRLEMRMLPCGGISPDRWRSSPNTAAPWSRPPAAPRATTSKTPNPSPPRPR